MPAGERASTTPPRNPTRPPGRLAATKLREPHGGEAPRSALCCLRLVFQEYFRPEAQRRSPGAVGGGGGWTNPRQSNATQLRSKFARAGLTHPSPPPAPPPSCPGSSSERPSGWVLLRPKAALQPPRASAAQQQSGGRIQAGGQRATLPPSFAPTRPDKRSCGEGEHHLVSEHVPSSALSLIPRRVGSRSTGTRRFSRAEQPVHVTLAAVTA